MMAVEEAGKKPELGWIVFDEAKAMVVEFMAHGAQRQRYDDGDACGARRWNWR